METEEPGQQSSKRMKKDDVLTRQFVLALLDKGQLKQQACNQKYSNYKLFVKYSLRNSENLQYKKFSEDQYEVIAYFKKQPESWEPERLLKFFLADSHKKWQQEIRASDAPQYSASALLFTLEGNPDLALAYLFGNWFGMINDAAIVKDFGVKTMVSAGMSDKKEGIPLETIKSIDMTMYRNDNVTHSTSALKKLGTFYEALKEATGSLEGLRILPKKDINTQLVHGGNKIKFNFKLPANRSQLKKDYIKDLRDQAYKFYKIYKEDTVLQDFESFFEPSLDSSSQIATALDLNLDQSWQQYVNDGIIVTGENFWPILYRVPRKDQIKEKENFLIKMTKGKSTAKVRIGGEKYELTNLISVSCINYGETFYRKDAGKWYEMPRSMISRKKKEIMAQKINSKDLFLSPAAGLRQPEDAYNISAVENMKSAQNAKFILKAILLDKINVEVSSRNKFELADILLKINEGRSYLIHVKRGQATDLDHHCQQIIRSANFMSDNLDRSASISCLTKSFIKLQYTEYVNLQTEKCSFFQKKFNGGIIKFQNNITETLNSLRHQKIRKIRDKVVRLGESNDAYKEMSAYDDALYQWLDFVFDYLSTPRDARSNDDTKLNTMRTTLESLLYQLEENKVFTNHTKGLLKRNERKKITFVLAIITNAQPDNYLIDNKVVAIYQTMSVVLKCSFQFKVTFIPVAQN